MPTLRSRLSSLLPSLLVSAAACGPAPCAAPAGRASIVTATVAGATAPVRWTGFVFSHACVAAEGPGLIGFNNTDPSGGMLEVCITDPSSIEDGVVYPLVPAEPSAAIGLGSATATVTLAPTDAGAEGGPCTVAPVVPPPDGSAATVVFASFCHGSTTRFLATFGGTLAVTCGRVTTEMALSGTAEVTPQP